MLGLFGCAAPRPPPASAPPSAVVLDLMQRLARANEAYRKMAEAGNSVVIALQGNEMTVLETRFADAYAPQRLRCPPAVRLYAESLREQEAIDETPMAASLTAREQRLARGLILLDEELRRAGHRHVDCVAPSPR